MEELKKLSIVSNTLVDNSTCTKKNQIEALSERV